MVRGANPEAAGALLLVRRFRRCPELVLGTPSGSLLEVVEARGPLARLLGLALLREPPPRALLIPRCRSVHTWGMRFPIDVVFAGAAPGGATVLAVHPSMGPRRAVSHGPAGGIAALELPAGASARLGLWPGRPLVLLGRRQSTTGATAAGAGRTNTRWPTS